MQHTVRLLVLPALFAIVAQATAGIHTARVEVTTPGTYRPLRLFEDLYLPATMEWTEFPAALDGERLDFWQFHGDGWPSPEFGRTSFDVLTSGIVLMAVTDRWGGGGNSSGNWIPELTSREELIEQGWAEVTAGLKTYDYFHRQTTANYIVFARLCTAGESFVYRTEKYQAPIVMVSPGPLGDANDDGRVTGADFTIWADHFDGGVGNGDKFWRQGDWNDDGFVTGADFTIWADHFGDGVAAMAVPEPALAQYAGALALAVGSAIGARRGLRRIRSAD